MKYSIVIDMGSTNTVILKNGVGVALDEPTLILLDKRDKKTSCVAFGEQAVEEFSYANDNYELFSPIRNGVIVDKEKAKQLLKHFLIKLEEPNYFKGNLLWILPSSISQNDKAEFINMGYSLGYKNVDILPTIIVGLQEFEIDYNNPYSHMLVNIGGGLTDVSVVYKGKVIQGCSVGIGGETVDNAIKDYLKINYNIDITTIQSEGIKRFLSTILPNDTIFYTLIYENFDDYSSKQLHVSAQELREIYTGFYDKICNAINSVLKMCNNQILKDISKTGIYMCGGMANMLGLDNYLSTRLGINVYIDDSPEEVIFKGAEKLLNEPQKLDYLIELNK